MNEEGVKYFGLDYKSKSDGYMTRGEGGGGVREEDGCRQEIIVLQVYRNGFYVSSN